jgi:hypothetical protein
MLVAIGDLCVGLLIDPLLELRRRGRAAGGVTVHSGMETEERRRASWPERCCPGG